MTKAVVIGAGPAGLIAAETMAEQGVAVLVCDAMPSFGRKFLMAGKSGLNLTKHEPFEQMIPQFGGAQTALYPMLKAFDATAVQDWAKGLGQDIFTGPTGRVFPVAMKASPLLRAWMTRLGALGVEMRTRMRWTGWDENFLAFETPTGVEVVEADVVVLALGGASWSRLGSTGKWQLILEQHGVQIAPFGPANAAVSVEWTDHMQRYFGAPLKACAWRAGNITSRGEAIISSGGLEGGGMYTLTPALRSGAVLSVDLAPDLSRERLEAGLAEKPAKMRLAHWLKNTLRLPPAKVALFFEMKAGQTLQRDDWVRVVKELHVRYEGLRPIDEAISTSGGVRFEDLTDDLMLKSRPGVFCAGEMLDWEAPTGGYLITGCLATGRWAGQAALRYLANAA